MDSGCKVKIDGRSDAVGASYAADFFDLDQSSVFEGSNEPPGASPCEKSIGLAAGEEAGYPAGICEARSGKPWIWTAATGEIT